MLQHRDVVIGVSPFEEPNAQLAVAIERAGGLGVVGLGRDAKAARTALADAARWSRGRFGVRVPDGCPLGPEDLPVEADTVVLGLGSSWSPADVGDRRVLSEVTSVAEALEAVASGAHGLIAKGSEAGGRIGDTTAFVLLQQLMAEPGISLPVWCAGGIGRHTAAAAVAGGATGVVLDAQLALVREADLGAEVSAAIAAMDGSETTVVAGHRVFTRPDLPVADPRALPIADPQSVAAHLGGRDLRAQYLPIGQDGAFAKPLADRYVTAGAVVAALRQSIESHLVAAAATQPLAQGSALAAARGLTHPVAQGPMTRVSDRAAFALAVADGGGLPFLALALMGGDEVRALLEETAALLRGRPWGVGVLGFVPAELRETQLAVVHDIGPPCALIAGGRPSQAAPLEAAGIDTFLHVPSPGLLDRFLRDGARKFVFEGRECGGHVGPRSSFALWEAQIERLLVFGAAAGGAAFFSQLHLLFAGGIHDERSAAMVAVAAAPLVERGAAVGVLMGTAYLFTDEAVASGAIVPGFQHAAIGCDTTVLLETSPGHATRCVESEYVESFRTTKQRLEDAGATQQEIWAELEQLNLGRLRLASKGLRRQGGSLVEIGEDEQRREGMVMIGEVATLRSSTTTVADLHAQVTDGATSWVAARAGQLGLAPTPTTVVGTGGNGAVGADSPLTTASIRAGGDTPGGTGAPLGTGAPGGVASIRAGGDTPLGVASIRAGADPLDIAIVGMACVFAAANDTERYWANIVGGIDAVTEVPADRWDVETYYDPDAVTVGAGRRTPSKWGGFLPEIGFDALAYGVPPSSLAAIDPAQLLALEVAARALADAGYAERSFDRDRTSVIFGAEAGTDLAGAYGFRALHPTYAGALPPELDEHLPHLTEDSFPGVLSNVISGRIANRLDLGGVNYTVDAACASSLAALDLACKELRSRSSDTVLCGGVDVHNGLQDYLLFASVHALSPTGRCRTFDASADGIALGEGAACVVLKRLVDAERDGDRVYAVVKAVAGSSDGKSLGLTAPRAQGQRRALERAYRAAGISPAEVGMVEAHGTGTVVGDRTELAALTELFTEAGATPGSCALGSVKSQIGHTKCAAGLAGLIKVARSLYGGVRAPTRQLTAPNPYWDADTSPFFFDTSARPWAAPPSGRHAGVSAFGFGGTNFHAVLSAYDGAPEPEQGLDEWPAELFVFRSASQIAELEQLLAANDAAGRPWRLRDLAATVATFGSREPVQVAVVADDLDDLAIKLVAARSMQAAPGVFVTTGGGATRPQVAFLFPGQGSQSPGMLSDLFVAFPRLRHLIELGEQAGAMFPPATFTRDGAQRQRDALTDTRAAQPALGVAGLAVHELLASLGVRPDLVGGHSYGEVVALSVAGAFDTTDLLALSNVRAGAILAAAGEDPGTMAAVAASAAAVATALGPNPSVVIANDNGPGQVVISGPSEAVEAAAARLTSQGLSCKRIPVACAFHSPVVAGASDTLASWLADRAVETPTIPVWSNTTAAPYPSDADGIRQTLAGQVAHPVRFVEQVEAMYAAGARVFVEAGPGRVLSTLVGKILGDRPHVAVACDVPGEPGLRRLLLALGQLAAAGVPVNTEALYRGRHLRLASAARVPRRPGWLVNGHVVRTAKGDYLPGGLRPANTLPPRRPVITVASDRDTAVLEFLRNTRELVAAQRDVVLGYLGTGGENIPALGMVAELPAPAITVNEAPVALPVPAATATKAVGPAEILAAVMTIVSDRTGYPIDMLDPDLDLEADLSIDSIKRTEILGELAEQVGLSGTDAIDESTVEELARLKTLNAIVGWVVTHVPTAHGAVTAVTSTEILAAVMTIVSNRTGYPIDMLDPDLDLEADLSIDSIKRTEILGELAEQVGLSGTDGAIDESTVEELARLKTLNAIVNWVVAHLAPEPTALAAAAPRLTPLPALATATPDLVPQPALATRTLDLTPYPALDAGGPDLTPHPALDAGAPGVTPALYAGAPGVTPALYAGAPDLTPALYAGAPDLTRHPALYAGGPDLTPHPAIAAITPHLTPEPSGIFAQVAPALAPRPVIADDGPERTRRFVVELDPLPLLPVPPAGPDVLAGRRYVIVDGGLGIGLQLSELLEQRGAEVRILGPDQTEAEEHLGTLDGAAALVHLAAADPDCPPVLPAGFALLREAAQRGVERLVVVTGSGGRCGHGPLRDDVSRAGLGLSGLIRTIAAEYPAIVSQLVDIDPKEQPAIIAGALLAELVTANTPVVVAYAHGSRTTRRVVAAELNRAASSPQPEIGDAVAALGLGPDSVVLLTGGARGITSKVAVTLARATGCHIELIGRTQAPSGPEDAVIASALDAAAIRRSLIASGVRVPSQVEVATARLLAMREIRTSLAELAGAAASARYHVVDVRDRAAVAEVVTDIYRRHGRLDGVIHGAGVLEDKRMSDKGMESFERVYRTKVDGARHLVESLRSDLGFLVLFGSVSGVFGNRGQADYASANDALDSLAQMWSGDFSGRVVAMDWGPWAPLAAGAGMVSAELQRQYARHGVGMIDVDDGVACLLRELAWGPRQLSQVVYMRAVADAMSGTV